MGTTYQTLLEISRDYLLGALVENLSTSSEISPLSLSKRAASCMQFPLFLFLADILSHSRVKTCSIDEPSQQYTI